jgi:transposase
MAGTEAGGAYAMRPFKRVKMLDADEYRALKKAAASRKMPAGKVRRAKIILLSNQGYTAREIAAKLDCNERTALRWINRFNRYGVVGLEEGPREGRPRVYRPEDVGAVIQAALTPPQELGLPFGSWTLDRLVAYLKEGKGIGMGRTGVVAEVLSAEGLRWRKQEGWFGERVDPEFASKRGPSSASTHPRLATP